MLPSVELVDSEESTVEVFTRSQAAHVLGVSANTVGKLLGSGFLRDLQAARVCALARAPHVSVVQGVLPVLRTAAAVCPADGDDDRDFIGDSPDLSDEQFLRASRQWWRCDPETIVAAGVLPVAVAGWVTGVLAVQGHEGTRHGGRGEVRHSFTATVAGRVGALDAPATFRVLATDRAVADLTGTLLGARVHTAVSGGPIAYLRVQPAVGENA
ncbi:DNA-binding protein [Streptomyces sp. NPDC053780]|uniref:DNA-binding protein n=1 Tax=unclassified Streptomyces TaxID=2593676 RepID=UPI000F749B63|nr:DNA-binding protein [Streptomyces sp. WAC 04229]RSN39745.1 DNA-binding protein [Streptomyces sp. WAC 04229]